METNTKTAKRRACGSSQTSRKAGGEAACAWGPAWAVARRAPRPTSRRGQQKGAAGDFGRHAHQQVQGERVQQLAGQRGGDRDARRSSAATGRWPRPAGGRANLLGHQHQQRGAGSARRQARRGRRPARPARCRPAGADAISAVAAAAPTPPRHKAAMPPMIHGVRRPPRSEPKPSAAAGPARRNAAPTSAPGRIAGSDSSTTITRLSVTVASTTTAPSAACTSPSRTMASQLERHHATARKAKAVTSMPITYRRGAGRVVPGRLRARVAQQPAHQQHLRAQQQAHAGGMDGEAPGKQQRHHATCGTAITAQASRAARSAPSDDRQRAHAHLPVALDGLEIVQRHDAVRAEAVERGHRHDGAMRQAACHDGGAGEPGQPFVAGAARRVAQPAVQLQAQRRRAIGPGQRQAEHGGAERPRAQRGRDGQRQQRPEPRRGTSPPWPGTRPDGIGRRGSLIASTWRSYQSFTAWLVPVTSGPHSATPAATSSQRPCSGAPAETMPQPNAHIGANQVIGLSSSP